METARPEELNEDSTAVSVFALMQDTRKYKVFISEIGSEFGDRKDYEIKYFPTQKDANEFTYKFNLDESNMFTNSWFRYASFPIKN